MAGTAGRNFLFKLASTDYSGDANDLELSNSADLKDSTTFGASVTAKSYTATLTDGSIAVKGPWVAAFFSAAAALIGATAVSTFELGPTGSTPTNQKVTGNCRVKSMKVSGKVDDILQMQLDLQLDGTVTYGTY